MATKDRAQASAQPVVLVLASGRGERFAASGGMVHKLRAALGDKTVLEHTLAACPGIWRMQGTRAWAIR